MLRFLTAGESHGPGLTVIVEGLPAGIPVAASNINAQLARRQKSEGSGGRMAIESDRARITGGVMAGRTTGGPVALIIVNKDFAAWKDRDIPPMTIPRPGHVDLNAAVKYGYRDLRLGLERASARETAARVAMGALCKTLLGGFGIEVGSYVLSIGPVKIDVPDEADHLDLCLRAEHSPVRCPDEEASAAMVEAIAQAAKAGDTLGGTFQCVAVNVPTGLGSHVHWDRRLSARLMAAVGSIPAIKGVQIGTAFDNATQRGTDIHDEIIPAANGSTVRLRRATNRAGGIEGGITNGEPVLVSAAMKPISTTLRGIRTTDLVTGEPVSTAYERSDICAVPRAAVVAEAMVAFVLADALIEKLGGDSVAEMLPRFARLRSARFDDLPMDNVPWRFGFDEP